MDIDCKLSILTESEVISIVKMILKKTAQQLVNKFGYSVLRGVRTNFTYEDEVKILKHLEVKTIFDIGAKIGQT